MSETRLQGVMIALYKSASPYGGSYGEILVDAEKDHKRQYFTFDSGHVFRNTSHPEVGAIVTFEVVSYSYATNIDRVDKHKR